MFDKLPLVIDIVASHSSEQHNSYPIELGVAMNGNGLTFAKLVRPADNWTEWTKEEEKRHGCSRQKLLTDGERPERIARDLNQLFMNKTLYSAHAERDKKQLRKLFGEAGVSPQLELQDIRDILSQDQLKRWNDSRQRVIKLTRLCPTRADTSALITRSTYMYSLAPQTFESRFAFTRDQSYLDNMCAA